VLPHGLRGLAFGNLGVEDGVIESELLELLLEHLGFKSR